jgi:hypothetical protein
MMFSAFQPVRDVLITNKSKLSIETKRTAINDSM